MLPRPGFAGKNDEDKSCEDLLEELRLLRGDNARLREIVARYEKLSACSHPPVTRDGAEAGMECAAYSRALEVLYDSERFLNDVLDSITDGISVLNAEMDIIRVNRTMETWHPDMLPLAGRKCYYAYHGRSEPCEGCESIRAMREKAPRVNIVPRDLAGRTVGWQEVFSFPLRDDSGEVLGVINYVRDITDRKRTEEALKKSEERFRVLAELTSAAICIMQGDRFLFVNPAMETITGYSREELLSAHFMELVHEDSREQVQALYEDWLRGRRDEVRFEFTGRSSRGKQGWIDVVARSIDYSGGRALLLTGIDVTDRKRTEKALRESERTKTVLMDGIPECMFMLDRNGIILDTNSVLPAIMGRSKKELIGTYAYDLIGPATARQRKARIDEVFATGQPARFEDARAGACFENVITPIVSGNGEVEKVAVIAIDITGRKRTEAALTEAKSRAELYLDLMGHDINNMHQIAMGYLELAKDEQNLEHVREHLDLPIEVLQRSARLIQNVRKLQKHLEGEFRPGRVEITGILREVQREYGTWQHKTVTLDLNGHGQCHVMANELLFDVFANLVSNAIKHTGVQADVAIVFDQAEDEGRRYCRVVIEDNGPGIPDGFKGKIFNRLLKGNDKAKGMGLGLYIVKTLVDSYGGLVWVEDRVPGDYRKGARFVVTLPVADGGTERFVIR